MQSEETHEVSHKDSAIEKLNAMGKPPVIPSDNLGFAMSMVQGKANSVTQKTGESIRSIDLALKSKDSSSYHSKQGSSGSISSTLNEENQKSSKKSKSSTSKNVESSPSMVEKPESVKSHKTDKSRLANKQADSPEKLSSKKSSLNSNASKSVKTLISQKSEVNGVVKSENNKQDYSEVEKVEPTCSRSSSLSGSVNSKGNESLRSLRTERLPSVLSMLSDCVRSNLSNVHGRSRSRSMRSIESEVDDRLGISKQPESMKSKNLNGHVSEQSTTNKSLRSKSSIGREPSDYKKDIANGSVKLNRNSQISKQPSLNGSEKSVKSVYSTGSILSRTPSVSNWDEYEICSASQFNPQFIRRTSKKISEKNEASNVDRVSNADTGSTITRIDNKSKNAENKSTVTRNSNKSRNAETKSTITRNGSINRNSQTGSTITRSDSISRKFINASDSLELIAGTTAGYPAEKQSSSESPYTSSRNQSLRSVSSIISNIEAEVEIPHYCPQKFTMRNWGEIPKEELELPEYLVCCECQNEFDRTSRCPLRIFCFHNICEKCVIGQLKTTFWDIKCSKCLAITQLPAAYRLQYLRLNTELLDVLEKSRSQTSALTNSE